MWKPEHRRAADRRGLRYPSDLTDAEWALIEPVIPPAKRGGRRREVNVREVLNAIFYVLSTGCQWQALPKDLPPKSTAHSYFMLWEWDGTLERIHHALYVATREREGREASPTRGDHRQPERQGRSKGGSALDPQGFDAGKKVTGRKRHILVDTLGLSLNVVVHPADVQDRDGAAARSRSTHAPPLPLHRAHLRRCRLSGSQSGHSHRQDRHLEARDRQTQRAASLRRPTQTLDRRTNPRLDQPQPPPRARLRALRANRRRLRPSRHDPHHAPTLDQASSFILNPNFLDRL